MDSFSEDLVRYLRAVATRLIKPFASPLCKKILKQFNFPIYCHYFHLNKVLSEGHFSGFKQSDSVRQKMAQ